MRLIPPTLFRGVPAIVGRPRVMNMHPSPGEGWQDRLQVDGNPDLFSRAE